LIVSSTSGSRNRASRFFRFFVVSTFGGLGVFRAFFLIFV
jgi:hypothetical protein